MNNSAVEFTIDLVWPIDKETEKKEKQIETLEKHNENLERVVINSIRSGYYDLGNPVTTLTLDQKKWYLQRLLLLINEFNNSGLTYEGLIKSKPLQECLVEPFKFN